MTYTFKLSRRLAGVPLGLLLAAVLGCQDAQSPEDTVTGIGMDTARGGSRQAPTIVPDSAVLETGQQFRFRAYGISSGQDTTELLVTWATTGGEISILGNYTAPAPGSYLVIARSRWRDRSDTARVRVLAQPVGVVTVVLTPDVAVVSRGASRKFSASAKLSDSSTAPIGAVWSATGGTVDPTGAYTADSTPGTYHVVASTTDGSRADTATVTIPADSTSSEPPPAPTPPALARVVLSPASATLATGGTQQFAAFGRNTAGDSIAVSVGYAATGGSISSAGLYTAGSTAGSFRVIAVQTGGTLADTSSVTITAPPPPPPAPAPAVGKHVTPSGSGTACSATQPCSFTTAISGSAAIVPGDTVWVHGGTYRGEFNARLAGSSSAPIVVRAARGERAIIDGPLFVYGADTWWWGLEHTYSLASGNQRDAIYAMAARIKLINCYIHDAWGNAVGAHGTATDFELTGCVAVHNGLKGSGSHTPDVAHGFYASTGSTGTTVFRDFILTGTQGYGLHFYTSGNSLRDITVTGAILYANGQQDGCNVTIGSVPIVRLTFTNNAMWEGDRGNGCLWLGREGSSNGPGLVEGNTVFGGDPALRFFSWGNGLTVRNNTIVQGRGNLLERTAGSFNFDGNRWYGSESFSKPGATDAYTSGRPTGQTVYLRPNPYEPGRANVAVYNWSGAGSATVTVPGLGAYEVRTPEAFAGAPVATGTGPSVTLPLGGKSVGVFVVVPR